MPCADTRHPTPRRHPSPLSPNGLGMPGFLSGRDAPSYGPPRPERTPLRPAFVAHALAPTTRLNGGHLFDRRDPPAVSARVLDTLPIPGTVDTRPLSVTIPTVASGGQGR
ncbi:hypothetical protein APR08_004902 [Nocardia amikacinitolerans]|nr:hypothetical protein [Nocardia amikacinitolerans]